MNIYSTGANYFRARNLRNVKKDPNLSQILANANIYLICRRPKVLFVEHSVNLLGREIRGQLAYKKNDIAKKVHFHIFVDIPITSDSTVIYGNRVDNYIQISDPVNGDTARMAPEYIIQHAALDDDTLRIFDVLYVGQSQGKDGDRNALERLVSHETLQKISLDTLNEYQDDDILIVTFNFEFYQKIATNSQREYTLKKDETPDLVNVLQSNFTRKSRIDMAEAALIQYFKPFYNEKFKKQRLSKKHKALSEAFAKNFSALITEVNTEACGIALRSEEAPPNRHHIIEIDLYEDKERESFFTWPNGL